MPNDKRAMTPEEIREILKRTADQIDNAGDNACIQEREYGRTEPDDFLAMYAALEAVTGQSIGWWFCPECPAEGAFFRTEDDHSDAVLDGHCEGKPIPLVRFIKLEISG